MFTPSKTDRWVVPSSSASSGAPSSVVSNRQDHTPFLLFFCCGFVMSDSHACVQYVAIVDSGKRALELLGFVRDLAQILCIAFLLVVSAPCMWLIIYYMHSYTNEIILQNRNQGHLS